MRNQFLNFYKFCLLLVLDNKCYCSKMCLEKCKSITIFLIINHRRHKKNINTLMTK